MDWLINNEAPIRLSCFAAVLATMLIWERFRPRRIDSELSLFYSQRRLTNLLISIVNTFAIRLLPGIAAIHAAYLAEQNHFGLLKQTALPDTALIIIAVVLLDLMIYFQHRVFHAVPWLWRLHRMHHSDRHFDTTTAIRFHPFEIVLSMLIKFSAVLLLGAPVAAVILFEIILNASALFNHGNVELPRNVDTWLRKFFVTPDMHRVHHSVIPRETDSNFGFCFSFWDRLFASYRAQPALGHINMTIGLYAFQDKASDRLFSLLLQPLRKVDMDSSRQGHESVDDKLNREGRE